MCSLRLKRSGVLVSALFCVSARAESTRAPEFSPIRTERRTVPEGAEVITYFQSVPLSTGETQDVPLLSVLKDTLDGSGETERLRQVWIFTYRRPSFFRSLAGAVPFLYTRAPLPQQSPGKPDPVLDMASPSRGAWKKAAGVILQTQVLDPISFGVRLVTRSYAGNLGEYRTMHLWQALDALEASWDTQGNSGLDRDEIEAIQGRLQLSGQIFGAFVADEYLQRAHDRARTLRMQLRAANWDLLRRKAEENGLYFQPLSIAGLPAAWALLWVPADAVAQRQPFDRSLLGISNPYGDKKLESWGGYTETWWLDRSGVVVPAATKGARAARMIPLALYALDHSRAPLLLADMRRSSGPKRVEMTRRFAADVTQGALTFNPYANLAFLGAKGAYMFVRTRHGVPTDRSARVRAYIQVQHALAVDSGIPPALRAELSKRVRALDTNPLEHDWDKEVSTAVQQYASFLAYVDSPDGLARQLRAGRERELQLARHGVAQRTWMRLATIATAGAYRHREKLDDSEIATLAALRRGNRLKTAAESLPPKPPVVAAGDGLSGTNLAQGAFH